MSIVIKDRVKETSSIIGTGPILLDGAQTGYQAFNVIGNGNKTFYCIADQIGSNWEVGIGTYNSSINSISRDTVLASNNNGNLVFFNPGFKDVFVTYPAENALYVNELGSTSISGAFSSGSISTGDLTYTGTLTGSSGIMNIGSGQLYKNASGYVGIGTTSPFSPAGYGALTINGSTGSILSAYSAGAETARLQSTTTSTSFGTITALPLQILTNATERMRIDPTGNVGIGVTSMASTLHVSASASLPGTPIIGDSAAATYTSVASRNSNASGIPGISLNSNLAWTTSKSTGQIRFDGLTTLSTYTVYSSIYSISGTNTTTGAPTDMLFTTSDGTATAVERMRINSVGNLGLGIATITPYASTATNRTLQLNNTSNANTEIRLTNVITGTGASIGGLIQQAGNDMYVWNASNSFMSLGTNAAERMRIDSAGNVGVGTSSPSAKLHVNGNIVQNAAIAAWNAPITVNQINVASIWNNGPSTVFGHNTVFGTGYAATRISAGYASTIGMSLDGLGSIDFSVAGTDIAGSTPSFINAMRITSAGNVAIGATSSAETFKVGAGAADTRATFRPNTPYAIGVANGAAFAGWIGGSGVTDNMVFSNSGGIERVRIDSAGNVAIGATSAAVKLVVSSTDSILLPKGTVAQRPTGVSGYLRFNTDSNVFEGHNGTSWASLGGSAGITSGTAQATTSGTAIDFTGIPAGVKRITVIFNQVSLSATSHLLVQIGSGSVSTTGYISSSGEVSATTPNTTSGITSTAGFPVYLGVAASSAFGIMTLAFAGSGNTWVSSHAVGKSTASANGGGAIVLGGVLDRLRLTSVSGTDTFDFGTVNIFWE